MDEKLKEVRYNSEKAAKFFTKIMAFTLGPVELKEMHEKKTSDIVILDVRDKNDYEKGHILDAISMPRAEMDDRVGEFSKEKLYIVYCYNQQCHLGACACRFLSVNGFHAMLLEGGFKTWSEDFGLKVTK